MDKQAVLGRIGRAHTLSALSSLFRELVRDELGIKEALTYTELAQAVGRKHLPVHVKPATKALCKTFEEHGYSAGKADKEEIERIKKELGTLVADLGDVETAAGADRLSELKQRRKVELDVKEHLGKGQRRLTKQTAEDIRVRLAAEKDKEFFLLQRFIMLCDELGEKRAEVKERLVRWGFPKEKLSVAFSSLGGAGAR